MVLGEPNIYHDSGVFYKNVGILLGGCLTVKFSGSYSQEMMLMPLPRVLVFEVVIICHCPICNSTRRISTVTGMV